MLELKGLRHAERFVTEQKALGKDVRWDGWDIVFFRTAPEAYGKKQGVFRNGTWGYDNRSVVNGEGIWEVDFRNVGRRIPTARR